MRRLDPHLNLRTGWASPRRPSKRGSIRQTTRERNSSIAELPMAGRGCAFPQLNREIPSSCNAPAAEVPPKKIGGLGVFLKDPKHLTGPIGAGVRGCAHSVYL